MGKWVYPAGWGGAYYTDADIPSIYGPEYNLDVSLAHIENYLSMVNESIRKAEFLVDTSSKESRTKNAIFTRTYGMYSKSSIKGLLTSLDINEFCHIKKTEYPLDLYVFCPTRELFRAASGSETIPIYIKYEYDQSRKNKLLVVSLHQLERPIYLPFGE